MDSVDLEGVTLAYLTDGPEDGPPVVVVHGFPDTPYSWQGLAEALAAQGFRVFRPFQRGYAPSSVPANGRYQTGQLALDVSAFAQAVTEQPVTLIGHDWGAMAVYGAATLLGDRCAKVVGMSVPPSIPPTALFSYDQAKRSFYMFFFQLPVDTVVSDGDFAFLDGLWDDWTAAGTESGPARQAVKDALEDPANLGAALGYYRALFAPDPAIMDAQLAAMGTPPQPLLYLHGADDLCMGLELTDHVEGRVMVGGANHFLQLDAPDEIARHVLEFLA